MKPKNPTRDHVTDLFRSFAGQVNTLTIPRPYIDLCGGDHLAALLLSQILYWSDRTDDANGWFAKSYEEWHEELAMTEYQVKRAINGDKRNKNAQKALKDFGVESKLKPSNFHNGAATLHYRVNVEKLQTAVINFVKDAVLNNVQIAPQTLLKTPPQQSSELYTETTSEPTSETIEPQLVDPLKDDNAIALIIKAWLDGQTTKPVVNQYANKSVRSNAKAIADAGFTPEQVTAYVKVLATQAYWSGKLITIGYVANNIAAHYAANKPAAVHPSHVPFSAVETTPDDVPPPPEALEALKLLQSQLTDEVTYAKSA